MGIVGSVQFQIVPCSSFYLFSRSISPLQCLVNVNYRVLICCTVTSRAVPSSLCFLCLQISSVSNFYPDTSRRRYSLISAHLFSCVVDGEKQCKQISLACVGSARRVWTTSGFATAQGGMCFLGLHCSGSRVLCNGTV